MENDVFEKATSVMTNRRMQAVSENQMRIEEINKKIPEINEINVQLYNTSKEIMKIISQRNDVGDRIQKLKASNLDAQ